jgi:hypothetical protein
VSRGKRKRQSKKSGKVIEKKGPGKLSFISELGGYQQRLYSPQSNHLESVLQSDLSFKQPFLHFPYIGKPSFMKWAAQFNMIYQTSRPGNKSSCL